MPLPSLDKTWQYSLNINGGTSGATAMLALKNALIGFGSSAWTVVSSSNSSTAGNTDKWVTSGNIVFALAGNAHSWMVLKQTGILSNFQVCLDCLIISGGSQDVVNIFISPSSGFTGGTTAARPTATDEINVNHANGSQLFGPAANFGSHTIRSHVWLSSDGQCTRIVNCSNALVYCFLAIDVPKAPVASWTNPWVVIYAVQPESIAVTSPGWARYTDINHAAIKSFGKFGSTTFNFFITSEGCVASMLGEQQTFVSDIDAGWPVFGPPGIYSTTIGARGRHGELFDLWWGSTTRANGDHYPASAARTFVQACHLILPWNGGAAMLTS